MSVLVDDGGLNYGPLRARSLFILLIAILRVLSIQCIYIIIALMQVLFLVIVIVD